MCHDGCGVMERPELPVDTGVNIASLGEDRKGEPYISTSEGQHYVPAQEQTDRLPLPQAVDVAYIECCNACVQIAGCAFPVLCILQLRIQGSTED